MTNRIQYRRDNAAGWTAANPVLANGEPGYETDTKKRKIGDGTTAWTALGYQAADEATLKTIYAPVINLPWGPKVCATGDSKVATNVDQPNNVYGDSWLTHLWLASDGDLDAPNNAGHGGYTSTQLAALFATEVFGDIRGTPNVVIEDMGTNDTLDGSNTASVTIANLSNLLTRCRAAGSALVITTLTPSGMAALGTPAAPTVTVVATGGTFGVVSPQYRVTAVNGGGVGATMAGAAVTATISSGSTNSVVIEAPFVAGATGYGFYRSDDGGSTWGLIGTTAATGASWVPVRTFTDTNITKGATVPASDTTAVALTTTARQKILTINAAKKRFAAQNGLVCIDFYSQTTDPATGMWKTGFTRDGTHPTPTTSKVLGQYAWAKLASYFRRRPPISSMDNADPLNVYPSSTPNGLHLTGSGTAPTGWGPSVPAGGTSARAARTGHNGNAFVHTRTTWATNLGQGPWFTTIPGHVYAVSMCAELVGGDTNGATGGFGFKWHNGSGPAYAAKVLIASDFGPSRIQAIVTCPTGATQLEPLNDFGPGEGTGAISQVWCVDLTAAGLT